MIEKLFYEEGDVIENHFICDSGVFIDGEKVAQRYYKRHGIKYGALSIKMNKANAKTLIKKRRKVFGNQYKYFTFRHFTKNAGGRYIVYISLTKKGDKDERI